MPTSTETTYSAAIKRRLRFIFFVFFKSTTKPSPALQHSPAAMLPKYMPPSQYACEMTADDAQLLAKDAAMTRQPIAVQTDSLPVLEAALRYFPGRLIIDSDCALEEDVLSPLAAKYGAILY